MKVGKLKEIVKDLEDDTDIIIQRFDENNKLLSFDTSIIIEVHYGESGNSLMFTGVE